MLRLTQIAALLAVTACTVTDPLSCDQDNICSDPDRPFCDVDGVYEISNGIGFTCIPRPELVYCSEEAHACFDGVQYDCGKEEVTTSSVCQFGCNRAGTGCDVPGYTGIASVGDGEQVVDFDTPIIVDTNAAEIRTDAGTIPFGDAAIEPAVEGGAARLVVRVASWTTDDVNVQGGPALVILSQGDIVLNGEFDVGTSGRASQGVCGAAWGGNGSGSGFGAPGGDSGTSVGFTGVSGSARMTPLRGGCGPSGAGAVHFATQQTLRINRGFINAAGYGGTSTVSGFDGRMTAGGSGGGVLIEADKLEIARGSGITANGGSGACLPVISPSGNQTFPGNRGSKELGVTEGPDACVAGVGGGGGSPVGGDKAEGSAGGGVGRIRINTADGWTGEGLITPRPSLGTLYLQYQ